MTECPPLRVRDINFAAKHIIIRSGGMGIGSFLMRWFENIIVREWSGVGSMCFRQGTSSRTQAQEPGGGITYMKVRFCEPQLKQ